MTNGTKLYVPVLRWKPAERRALSDLKPSTRAVVQPLIEVVPKYVRDRERRDFADGFARQLVGHWGQRPHFVDFAHVHTPLSVDHRLLISEFAKAASERTVNATPVLRASFAADRELLKAYEPVFELGGLAIRVTRDDLSNNNTHTRLASLARSTSISAESTDLILDYRLLDGPVDMPKTFAAIQEIAQWRSVTFLGGSFPKDLSELTKNEQHELVRHEWHSWKMAEEALATARFGDYTIQHPLFLEPPANANFSASIRYTAEDWWVIMRGESVRNETGPGFKQYPAQAELLVLRPEYKGAEYSAGDRYIEIMARQQRNSGNPQTWLRAGINHHMELVARQLVERDAA